MIIAIDTANERPIQVPSGERLEVRTRLTRVADQDGHLLRDKFSRRMDQLFCITGSA